MTRHELGAELGRSSFDPAVEPALTVAPGAGDEIVFTTSDEAYAQMEQTLDLAGVTATLNPVTGPLLVEGAVPGDLLAVHIHDIALAPYGWSVHIPGAGALSAVMGEQMRVRRIPVADGLAQVAPGVAVPVAPMVGCLGIAPAEGSMSTVMPTCPGGGNMDLTDARPGSTVHLPVAVPGALLSIGDLHAVMSRGEASFVAIEAAGSVTVSVDVVPGGARVPGGGLPWVDTGDELVFVGLGDPVQESVRTAYEALFHHLVDGEGWDPMDAYALMSAVAHTELGGPTGSRDPDPLHPLRPVGAVTLARIAKTWLSRRPPAPR